MLVVMMLSVFTAAGSAQEQINDSDFEVHVEDPAYTGQGPVVAIDEGHENFHSASGRYKPFADLLRSDGYSVISLNSGFVSGAFDAIDVLVISNALPDDDDDPTLPAFTEDECEALYEWVRSGGSLLFIADHAPFGSSAEVLAKRFGVEFGKGWAFDTPDGGAVTSHLEFSRENGLLGDHTIMDGRSEGEQIRLVKAFTGQSLTVPAGAVSLMKFSRGAREAATREDVQTEKEAWQTEESRGTYGSRSVSVEGRAQGIAMKAGKGRVVILGEASMMSAQLVRFPDGREIRFGMNVPGNDNRQFALNVMHWLSGLLD
jgi:hypothetical protein